MDAHGAGSVLDRIIVRPHRPAHVSCECQHIDVHGREPADVPGLGCGLPDALKGVLGGVQDAEDALPEIGTVISVLPQFPDDPGRAAALPLGKLGHGEERRTVEDLHAFMMRRGCYQSIPPMMCASIPLSRSAWISDITDVVPRIATGRPSAAADASAAADPGIRSEPMPAAANTEVCMSVKR